LYNNGDVFEDKSNKSIPRNIAWIEHYSWLNKDSRSKEKIDYQNQRFSGGCAFKWNEECQSLEFVKEFYEKQNLETPILHETIDKLSKEFTIDFLRSESKILIKNVQSDLITNFRIYNGQSGNLIYETTMSLTSNTNYFIWSEGLKFLNTEGFKKFRFEVVIDNNIIHNEFIHI